ncbi:MAG: DJ-1/PfpI family protein [Thermomicrobiales bacterium]
MSARARFPGAAGLLDGLRATSHWSTIDRLRQFVPNVTVLDDERVVDQGEVITSAGVSAGIDMALHVVRRLHDAVAVATARDMEYDWALAPHDHPPGIAGGRHRHPCSDRCGVCRQAIQ